MYNYFCNHNDKKKIVFIRNLLLLITSLLISSAFIVKGIIDMYLMKYHSSVNVIFILFAAQFFSIIIKGIYINLYKVEKKQKIYFQKMIFVVVLGAVLNVLMGRICNTIESYALATLLSVIVWLILCYYDFASIRYRFSDLLYITINILAFFFLGFYTNFIFGFIAYIAVVLVTSFIWLNKETLFIIGKISLLFKKVFQ